MAIGGALSKAKRDYTFGYGSNDAIDRKTVTEFNLFGVPWAFIYYPNEMASAGLLQEETVERAFIASAGSVTKADEEGTYTQTFEINIESYEVDKEEQEGILYDLFSVKGGSVAAAPGTPILPYVRGYSLPLPFEAKILEVKIVEHVPEEIGKFNVPNAVVQPWSEGGMIYTEESDIDYFFPMNEDLVQYQQSGNEVVFTVFPIQHNPTSDDTIFYRNHRIQVTYKAPLTVTITRFETDKSQYAPGEEIRTTTQIDNVGDLDATLRARLSILDGLGEEVGSQGEEFAVHAGGSYDLALSWVGMLEDGAYTAQIAVYSGESKICGASSPVSVAGGAITSLTVPEPLYSGEAGLFEVTFSNFKYKNVKGEARLRIQQGEGGYVRELPPQPVFVDAGSSQTLAFYWTPIEVGGGSFSATAEVIADGQSYGPKSESFNVILDVCRGDLDRDGDVDGADMAVFVSEFDREDCSEEKPCEGDINPNGKVDEDDLDMFLLGFGQTGCPATGK
jgi:hypothetical protein